MSEERDQQQDSDAPPRGVVPDRGSIAGTGEGMSDEEALAILRGVADQPTGTDPDIEVVVGDAAERASQTQMPVAIEGVHPPIEIMQKAAAAMAGRSFRLSTRQIPLKKIAEPPRVIISREDLRSSMRAVFDQTKTLRLAEDALAKNETLRMRILMDKSTIDFDVSKQASDDLEATFSDLIDRSLG